MVAKLLLVAGLFALVLVAFIVAGFRYVDRQARRQHERQMARGQRDYETIMEYAEDDATNADATAGADDTTADSESEPE